MLVEGGANPKNETKDGKVPLCYAAASCHSHVLSYLVLQDHDTIHLMEDKKVQFNQFMYTIRESMFCFNKSMAQTKVIIKEVDVVFDDVYFSLCST
jgi:hypothetical protein